MTYPPRRTWICRVHTRLQVWETSSAKEFQVVEARAGVRDRLHGEGLDARLGAISRYMSVADALDMLQAKAAQPNAPRACPRPE